MSNWSFRFYLKRGNNVNFVDDNTMQKRGLNCTRSFYFLRVIVNLELNVNFSYF